MTNIETGVSTLRGLAEWILKQGIEIQMRPIFTYSVEDLNQPWNGVIEDTGDWVIISDVWTKAQQDAYDAEKREAQMRHQEWLETAPDREAERYRSQRAEVQEAYEKGLLP